MMRSIPFTRLGLLVIIGSVFASVIQFYLSAGRELADMSGKGPSTEPGDLLAHFTNNFLFAGDVPGVLLWAGVALCLVGIVRNFTVRGGRQGVHR